MQAFVVGFVVGHTLCGNKGHIVSLSTTCAFRLVCHAEEGKY